MQEKNLRAPTDRQRRTRAALVQAAAQIAAEGGSPTVSEAADLAGVGRATAYRYFAANDLLMTEGVLDQIAQRSVAVSLPKGAATPEDAAEALVDRVLRFVFDNRELFRQLVKLSVDVPGRKRGGRRLVWAREVLVPFADQLCPGALDDLVPQLALLLGPETMIALQDVAGQDDARTIALTRHMARALVAAYRV
jgi:AcrR family transcriptional regulator